MKPSTLRNLAFILASAIVLLGIAQAQTIDPGLGQETKPNPGSLFNPQSFQNAFTDRTARRVGDIVTILIDESSASQFAASTRATKNDSNSINTQFFLSFLDSIIKPFNTGASSQVNGQGSTSQTGSMVGRMSVVVRAVDFNGNLHVEGRRTLVTNRETQTFILSGVVRRDDISPLNTIPSQRLAEAEIRFEGEGLIQDRQRRGILTQILDWLF